MIIPPKLKIGDTIGIVSTARKISLDELTPAIDIIKSWGLQIKLGANLFKEYHQFSGTIAQRTSDLQTMIDDDSINAILCARGGYGTVQIIDQINFTELKKNPKWIIGYSDITILHSHLNNLDIASLHASMPINFSTNSSQSLVSLKKSLFEFTSPIEIPSHPFNKLGVAEGEIIGWNLSILYSLLGSKSDINTSGKILFIEDLDEYLYHIDRMIMSLKRNEKLNQLKGMIVGGMNDMNDNKIPFGKTAEQIIFDYTKDYNFPICFNFPAGHLQDNRTIILGAKSKLEITERKVIFSNNFQ